MRLGVCPAAIRIFLFSALALFSMNALTGCDEQNNRPWWGSIIDSCPINANQKGSFMAPVQNPEITLIVDNRLVNDPDHGKEYLAAVQAAADKWNEFGQRQKGQDFFSVTTGDVPGDLTTARFSDCQINDAGDENHFYIVMETNLDHWNKSGFTSFMPGGTVRCYVNGALAKQVIYVYPTLPNLDHSQFMSVILHELGHSLGLDHSCSNGDGNPSFIGCKSIRDDDSHPYHLAVMYPELAHDPSIEGNFAIKEDLQPNDIERASCFYHQ